MKTIDCRNMACPAPVVTVKRALEEGAGEELEVAVDPGAARENVTRFATSRGYAVQEREVPGGYVLLITSPLQGNVPAGSWGANAGPAVMLIGSDRLGDGPEDLGRLLMKNLIITLLDVDKAPDRMLFINTGVLLTTEGSEVLEALAKLVERGVEVMSCGVCLDFFHRREKLAAGSVTNMHTIAESLLSAGNVVRL